MTTLRLRTLPRPFAMARMVAMALAMSSACASHSPRSTAADPARVDLAQLWIEPTDIESRDLFQGPGEPQLAPDAHDTFTLVTVDHKGYSPGYRVKDAEGVMWDVKLGPEAQTEIVASRILWALGYFQPPIYYLPSWTLTGGEHAAQAGGRFRPELPDRTVVADWSWYENEFMDTMPFKGLVVANMVMNNWDWKTSNNKLYEVRGSGGPTRQFIVRDLGASFGKTSFPTALRLTPARGFGQGSRNDLEDFESQAFIKGVDGAKIDFDYRGIHQKLVNTLTPEQVVWACRLMARLSDEQYNAAFRAAGYPDDVRQRYVAKLRAKIGEGLALHGS